MTLVAVILAAGSGTRLRPLTDSIPKCLLEVAGGVLLDRLLNGLHAAGLARAIVVTGHLGHLVDAHLTASPPALRVDLVRNAAYATTNNAASLAAARTAIGGDEFLLCDADVVFSINPFPALLDSAASALAVDLSVEWDAEAMKVEVAADGGISRISKHLTAQASAGESVGLQKISGLALPGLWSVLESLVAEDAATAYYEDAFQRLIDRGTRFGVSAVAAGTWLEIDDAADLAMARQQFRE